MSGREALKRRTNQSAKDRGKKGLGKVGYLNQDQLGDREFYKPSHGQQRNVIDILPFVVSQDWYKRLRTFSGRATGMEVGDWDYKLEIPIHFDIGPGRAAFLCLNQAFGERCPICEEL